MKQSELVGLSTHPVRSARALWFLGRSNRSKSKSKNASLLCALYAEHPGDHSHQDIPTSIAIQMGGVLQYKWEAYCDTNGSTDSISFSSERRTPKILQYTLEAYCNCNTNWRCIAIQIREVVVVGVSDVLLTLGGYLVGLRGPAATPSISRDTSSDAIANFLESFVLVFFHRGRPAEERNH